MTDNLLLHPFVWINAYTPDSPSKRKILQLTGTVLESFTDETVFDIDASPGGSRSKTARAKVRFVLFDKFFTYWEDLFIINKRRIDVEYGWLNQDGTVATSSGAFPVTLVSIKPSYSYQGTRLEVVAVSDFSSMTPAGTTEFFYATNTFSIMFVPAKRFAQLSQGLVPYSSKFPHRDFALPATQRSKESTSTTDIAQSAPEGVTGGLDGLSALISGLSGLSVVFSEKVTKYESISSLFKGVAKSLGLKADVDDTREAPETAEFVFTNVTLMNMLSQLALEAESDDGARDYSFWVRGDTIFLKRPVPKEKFKRTYNYGIGSLSLPNSSASKPNSQEGVALGLEVEIQPNLVVNSAWAQAASATVDAQNKVVRGGNVVPPYKKVKDNIVASIKRVEIVEDSAITLRYEPKFEPPEGINLDTLINNPGYFISRDWLLWEQASNIAEEAVKESFASAFSDATKDNAFLDPASYESLLTPAKVAAYEQLKKDSDARISLTNDSSAESFVSASLAEDAIEQNKDSDANVREKDPTLAGRMYISPYQNESGAGWSKAIASTAGQKVFTAKLLAMGDVGLRLQQVVTLNILTPEGPHYTSGDYRVLGVNNAIDSQGFTTELTLISHGGITSTSKIESTTQKNKQYVASDGKSNNTVWTDVPTSPSPFSTKTSDPIDEADEQSIQDSWSKGRKFK